MKRVFNRDGSVWWILFGVVLQLLVCFAGATIIASLIAQQSVLPEHSRYYTFLVLALAGALGPVAAKRAGIKGSAFLSMTICCCAFLLMQLFTGFVVFDAVVGNILMNQLCILAGFGIACAICIRRGKSHRKKRNPFR